eukprot:1889798-Pleurochrysis_carterae.AAC.1
MRTTSHEPTRYVAKAIALNPVASNSNEVMCNHSMCSGESSRYQYMPWQYPPMPGGTESVAASAKAAT